jgi:lipid-A-disaccharide synthase-like uncharacterized protein
LRFQPGAAAFYSRRIMDWIANINWQPGFNDGRFLWIEWHFWKVIGWTGNFVFFSRFIVQWIATEKRKRVVVPTAFWWLSLAGTLMLLSYALFYRRDSVFIFAYAFAWIPYIRNLIIHQRHKKAHMECPACAILCPPQSNYCYSCGGRLPSPETAAR